MTYGLIYKGKKKKQYSVKSQKTSKEKQDVLPEVVQAEALTMRQ